MSSLSVTVVTLEGAEVARSSQRARSTAHSASTSSSLNYNEITPRSDTTAAIKGHAFFFFFCFLYNRSQERFFARNQRGVDDDGGKTRCSSVSQTRVLSTVREDFSRSFGALYKAFYTRLQSSFEFFVV